VIGSSVISLHTLMSHNAVLKVKEFEEADVSRLFTVRMYYDLVVSFILGNSK